MSRRIPLNVRFRPQPVTTDEIDRSHAAADRLLAEPADWLRRLHLARVDVDLLAPAPPDHPALEVAGFRPLCAAWLRHPGLVGRIERRVDVWIDPTTTIRAEVIGEEHPRVYLSTLFEDGSSMVSIPDELAEWIRSPSCEVLCGTGNVLMDLEAFMRRSDAVQAQGRRPLLCANGAAYQRHLRLAFLLQSKSPDTGLQRRVIYPMTLMLAAEVLAHRDGISRPPSLGSGLRPGDLAYSGESPEV